MKIKVRVESADCPLGKWPKVSGEFVAPEVEAPIIP